MLTLMSHTVACVPFRLSVIVCSVLIGVTFVWLFSFTDHDSLCSYPSGPVACFMSVSKSTFVLQCFLMVTLVLTCFSNTLLYLFLVQPLLLVLNRVSSDISVSYIIPELCFMDNHL